MLEMKQMSFLGWWEGNYMSKPVVSLHTCSFLERRDGLLQADDGLSVTTSTNLRVEGSHVEEDAGLL